MAITFENLVTVFFRKVMVNVFSVLLILIGFLFRLNVRGNQVFADDRCGPGYVCWEENGGFSAYHYKCEPHEPPSLTSYCVGVAKTDYCSCEGSSNCTCELGPDYNCDTAEITYTDTCRCSISGDVCSKNSDCVYGIYGGDNLCNDCNFGDWGCTVAESQMNTIGCCYGDNSSPDPSSPSPPPLTPYCDAKANGSPTDITTHFDYDIAWTSTGAESCTLNRNGSSIETTISGSRTEPADTNGTFNYLFSCSNLCAVPPIDRGRC